jgi:hypothetical protein
MNTLVEHTHASGCGKIQILIFDAFRAHLTVRFTSKRTGCGERAREQHGRYASDEYRRNTL